MHGFCLLSVSYTHLDVYKRQILGFAKGHGITAHHIRQADTLEFAKAGTMERELDKIFRD